MLLRRIIVLVGTAFAGCQQHAAPHGPLAMFAPPPAAAPVEMIVPGSTVIVETTETIEPILTDPSYPLIAPAPGISVPQHIYPTTPAYPMTPVYPDSVPHPAATPPTPGSIAVPVPSAVPSAPGVMPPSEAAPVAPPPNPILVPVVNDELAWEQIADVTSDYFRIMREVRARRSAGLVSEGFIETAPQGGATVLEPHRRDSVGEFNRWESTLQTIRRRCLVRVIPDPGGYLVGVEVLKELEDLPRPEQATAGASIIRTDGSLPPRETYDVSRTAESVVWIPLGRDLALEQQMLAEIQARLIGLAGPTVAASR